MPTKKVLRMELDRVVEALNRSQEKEVASFNEVGALRLRNAALTARLDVLLSSTRQIALRLAVQAVQPQNVTQTAEKYYKFLVGEND